MRKIVLLICAIGTFYFYVDGTDPVVSRNVASTLLTEKTISSVRKCYRVDCSFSNSDPRDYDYQVGQELVRKLEALTKQASTGAEDQDYSAIARKNLKVLDGHVKQAALDLLSTQPISNENFAAIVSDILHYHSDAMIEQAMLELERYQVHGGYEAQIDEAITSSFTGASPMVREKLATSIYRFLNEHNREVYREIATTFPWNSKTARLLRGALRRYARENI